MKTLLLVIGWMGCSTFAAYAQTKGCETVKKTTTTTTTTTTTAAKKATTHRVARKSKTGRARTMASTLPTKGCYIDSTGEIQYLTEGTYTGYYAGEATCDMNDNLKPAFKDMVITSTVVTPNGVLPAKYTCSGQGVNPPMNVTNVPQGAVSLAVVMFDPHATAKKSTTNWLIWNLSTDGIIPEGFATDHQSENPITKNYGYTAPCPQEGTHTYHIRVYALDTKLLLGRKTNKALLESAMKGHILSKGELLCKYNRTLSN